MIGIQNEGCHEVVKRFQMADSQRLSRALEVEKVKYFMYLI